MNLVAPVDCRGRPVRNPVTVSTPCQYTGEDEDGIATPGHWVTWAATRSAGPGIVMTDSTAVSPEGRLSPTDLGGWTDDRAALAPTAESVADHGAVPGHPTRVPRRRHGGRPTGADAPRRPGLEAGRPDGRALARRGRGAPP